MMLDVEVAPELPWRTFEAREVLVPTPGGVTLLAEGELEVHAQSGLLEFREGPAVLVGASRLCARTRVRLAQVPADRLCDALGPERAAVLLLQESERLERWRHGQLRRDEDFFADGQGGLVPGPYRFGPYEALSVLVRGATRHSLPDGLRPIPGLERFSLLVFSKVERCRAVHARSDHRDHGYREVAAFVPCLGPLGIPGFYLPEVYPDAYLPILFGREVYGFAKRMGRIQEHPRGFDLIASGTHRLRVRTSKSRPGSSDFATVMRAMSWASRIARPRLYLRKRILDVEAGRHRVDELVALPFSVFHLRPRGVHRASLECPDGQWSLPGHAVGALSLELGFTFADGKVIRRARWWRRG